MSEHARETIINDLISLSHTLGDETRDYVIIGEGNVSARSGADAFWIKASGKNLRSIEADGVVEINLKRIFSLVMEENATDEDITRGLLEARIDTAAISHPSVETVLHAILYDLTDARFIGHTHPVAVNTVLCSEHSRDITGHLMPDEIVVCGLHSVFVPYTDPGLVLARQVKRQVDRYLKTYPQAPRIIYLQNHGLLALGQTARQVAISRLSNREEIESTWTRCI